MKVEKKPIELQGRVEAVLVANTFGSIISTQVKKLQAIRAHGIRGDAHSGTRLLDVRERELRKFGLSKGTEIANYREFSAVSLEELTEIAMAMSLPETIPYGCLGENLVVSGIPKFTQLPTGTMLFFQKSETEKRTTVLVVWAENTPCQWPGEAIQSKFPDILGLDRLFPNVAIGKRGVVGSVYVSGNISAGDTVIVRVPKQRMYDPVTKEPKKKGIELMRPYSWWKFYAPVCPPQSVIAKIKDTGRYACWENLFWDGELASAMFYRTRLATEKEQKYHDDEVITHLLPGSYKPARGWLRRIPYPMRSKEKPNP